MKTTTILYILLALAIGFGAGYLVFRNTPPSDISSIQNEISPVSKSKWDNKVITSWQVDVRGNLTARDQSSFTLNYEGNSITLPLTEKTTFSDTRDPTNFKPVDFNALPLGTFMRGVVNIDREKGIFGAGSYTVQLE